MSKIISANLLQDGRAVFLGLDGTWTPNINEAAIAKTEDQEAKLLEAAEKAISKNRLIHFKLISVDLKNSSVIPVSRKERIRSQGPTVRTDLGTQAEKETARVPIQ